MIFCAPTAASSACSSSDSTTTNSSPPCRLTVSELRTHIVKPAPTARSSSSPTRCPSESLMCLKRSRSRNRTASHPLVAGGERKRAGQPVGQQHAVRQIGQRVMVRQMGQLQRRLLRLPPEVVLPQQRVTEHLEQLAVQDQPPARHRLLPPRHGPQLGKGTPLSRARRAMATDSQKSTRA